MDEKFMREALLEANKAFAIGEVPVGAVLVHNNIIIGRSHNQMESMNDASKHAELLCLKQGAQHFNNWRLSKCTLYTTLEPCVMCAGAIILFRIKRLVYGAKDLRHGAHLYNIFNKPHPIHNLEVTPNILVDEAKDLMQSFFKKRREHARTI